MYRDVPCVQNKILSIAYCQEPMRRLCNISDIIFGWGSKSENNNGKLLFCAEINTIYESPYYYKDHLERRDCVYKYDEKKHKIKFIGGRDEEYFRKRFETNIGHNLDKARVLLSDDQHFRTFFNDNNSSLINIYLKQYQDIVEYMCNKTRGAYCDQYNQRFCKLFQDIMNEPNFKYEPDVNQYDPKTSKKSKLNAMIPQKMK